jgi:hypothetical protein
MTVTVSATWISLDRGERQLWVGAPRRGIVFRGSDIFLIPFSLLWAGFAVFWEASVLRTGAPGPFAFFGVPFVLIGLYMTVGRFIADAWRRNRTSYVLSTDRVIIQSGGSVKSLALRTLSDLTVTERRDGTGTITFGAVSFPMALYAGTLWPGVTQPPALELIPNARAVYTQIREAQQASMTRAG